MRKHLQQMTKEEKAFVHGFLRANVGRLWSTHSHFFCRASERHFTLADAVDAARCGLVVEIHNNQAPDIRVLVRDQKGTCAVVSLSTLEVITVYYNNPEDTHTTLDWSPYRWKVNVVDVIKSLRRAA